MDAHELKDSIVASIETFLATASADQARLIDYAMRGIADGSIRDLTWVMGRKAGRVYIAQN